jgi:hypothetical protein
MAVGWFAIGCLSHRFATASARPASIPTAFDKPARSTFARREPILQVLARFALGKDGPVGLMLRAIPSAAIAEGLRRLRRAMRECRARLTARRWLGG